SQLYETIFCNMENVAILPEGKEDPIYLPANSITPVGFHADEEVIPSGENSHPAFRLIQEYFCFPEKYHFIDVHHLNSHESLTRFDLLLILNANPTLNVNENTFVPNCSPIINLFENNAGTIDVDHKKFEYHLLPDPDADTTTEIHSILSVSKSFSHDDREHKIKPFYGFTHEMSKDTLESYWHMRREETWQQEVSGTEVFLSFRDLGFQPTKPDSETVFVRALCTNRNFAEKIPAGALLELEEKASVDQSTFLIKPTPAITPPLRGPTLWSLISNLSLNYLSITDSEDSLNALRTILRTYNFAKSTTVEQQIMGIRSLTSKTTLSQTGFEGWRGFCTGVELTLTVDPSYYAGSSSYLFASVLSRFFSLYVSINSFAETILKRTTEEGIWKRWTPVKGKKPIL
ncbi:type VI secretion system baseplate subunit TssF, partial [bacterium]|nr:type VI secretion system baseplate subunit TssF [bacterium]